MFDVARVKADFSRAAVQYDAHAHMQKRVMLNLWERVSPFVAQDAYILDAGCGTGRLAEYAPQAGLVQLDIAFAMCARARACHHTLSVNAAMEALPFPDGVFDVVFSSLVLQWVNCQEAALAEMRRVLKPGGVLAVSTLGPFTLRELRESFTTLDNLPHVSDFHPPCEEWYGETITEHHPNLLSVMRSLKGIGAANKLHGRYKGLMTRGKLEKLERRYADAFAGEHGLPVTWEVLYLVESVACISASSTISSALL